MVLRNIYKKNNNKINGNFSGIHEAALSPTVSGSNWCLKMLVFVEGGNRSKRRKTLGERTRTNNKRNSNITAPSLLPQ